MKKIVFLCLLPLMLAGLTACQKKPTKVELLRAEKHRNDSIELVRTRMTLQSADSLLQTLIPEVEPLMKLFRYEKNEKYEDNGYYVHRLLRTEGNTTRNFMQAMVADDRRLIVRSYVYAARAVNQKALQLSVGEFFVEAEGSNHVFEAEGVHEIMSVFGDDALRLLQFVDANRDERIRVQAAPDIVYYLTKDEKQALSDTYALAALMKQIHDLEESIDRCNRQAEVLTKRLTPAFDNRGAQTER